MDGPKLMGTRRSRHNKGRKPFYKDHGRQTLADIAPVEPSRWEQEADDFLHDRWSNKIKMDRIESTRAWRIPKPDPVLAENVKAYLTKRQAEQARKAKADIFPDVKRGAEIVALPNFAREADNVEASRRDILIELFVERKISHGQMHAGRRWQADKERATLQPSRSIDWSKKLGGYQDRGSVNGHQWNAMRRRRSFVGAEGLAAATMLDFMLDADRGRRDLMQIMNISVVQIEAALDELLTKLCQHFSQIRGAA